MAIDLKKLLKFMVDKNASDLHITAGSRIHIRIDGNLVPVGSEKLGAETTKSLAYAIMGETNIKKFEQEKELDMSFGVKGLSRFRVNVFKQRGNVGAAIRALPYEVMTFEQCGLPVDVLNNFCKKPKGLILVTGATGSGKSTTLAAMVDKINREKGCHIITLEDPIEYVHINKKAVVDQREIGPDTDSFAKSLKYVLRQDPDVILIGEMRDLETIEAALTIAETGHLVLATLHTSDCVQTINRIIDVFPAHQQQQVRIQFSFVLEGILCQQLIPKAEGTGRVLGIELLTANYAIRNLIREAKAHQIYSILQTSQKEGMCTMNQSLADLYNRRLITYEEAMGRSLDREDLIKLIKG